MSKKRYEQLEILQDPDRKPKRKRKLSPIYIPWRWVALSFLGGAFIVGLLVYFGSHPSFPLRILPDPPLIISTPAPIPTLTGAGEFLRTLAWANGRLAAAGSDTLRVYASSISPGAAQWMQDYGQSLNRAFNTIALSPDGAQVAGMMTLMRGADSNGESDIVVWDAHTGDLLRTFTAHVGGSPASGYDSIAYSLDSTRMITSAGDGRAVIWDATTGQEVGVLETGGTGTMAMAVQPESGHLVIITQREWGEIDLQIWDIAARQQLERVAINRTDIWQVDLSHDAAYMAVLEWTEADQFFVSIWDVERGEQIGTLPSSENETIREMTIEPGLLGLAGFIGVRTDPTTGEMLDDSHSEVRVLSWQLENDGTFQYSLVGSKQDYLNRAEIRELHFMVDDSTAWLNYISGLSGLQRWNLDTGEVEALPFW